MALIARLAAPVAAAEWDAYFDLRWRVLRAPWGQPRGSERDGEEARADHLAAFAADGRVLGVGRVQAEADGSARVRFMATDAAARGQGVGASILRGLEAIARAHGVSRIVLDARESALGFYLRLGYRILGPGHTLFGTVHHQRLAKDLAGPGATQPR
jgi:ribosomal protein S18 acetylase RimI-like enzyme